MFFLCSVGFVVEYDGDRFNNLICGIEKGRYKVKNYRIVGIINISV